ncbi:MAG TPA: LamG domain-containing protein [Planctomycetota bacterium]|nr:LamG domain-containing protein [Planctomycetota bacterium]
MRARTWVASFLLVAACGAGARAQAVAFVNGVDGYVQVPAAANQAPTTGVTVEAWINYDDAGLGPGFRWPTVLRKNPHPGQEAYLLRVNASNSGARVLRWKIRTAAGQFHCDWPFAPGQLATWTHVAGVYDGATTTLYVDAVPVVSLSASGPFVTATGDLRIGKGDDAGGPVEVWNGQIDAVRLWPFARTAAEIAETKCLEFDGLPSLCSTWTFDGTLADGSGGTGGAGVGSYAFVPGAPGLFALPGAGAASAAPGTAACGRRLAVTTPALLGLSTFAVAWVGPAPGAPGWLAAAPAALPAPTVVAGIGVHVDFLSPFALIVPIEGGAGGVGRAPLPLPLAPALSGFVAYVQAAFAELCGPQGVGATDLLQITFL